MSVSSGTWASPARTPAPRGFDEYKYVIDSCIQEAEQNLALRSLYGSSSASFDAHATSEHTLLQTPDATPQRSKRVAVGSPDDELKQAVFASAPGPDGASVEDVDALRREIAAVRTDMGELRRKLAASEARGADGSDAVRELEARFDSHLRQAVERMGDAQVEHRRKLKDEVDTATRAALEQAQRSERRVDEVQQALADQTAKQRVLSERLDARSAGDVQASAVAADSFRERLDALERRQAEREREHAAALLEVQRGWETRFLEALSQIEELRAVVHSGSEAEELARSQQELHVESAVAGVKAHVENRLAAIEARAEAAYERASATRPPPPSPATTTASQQEHVKRKLESLEADVHAQRAELTQCTEKIEAIDDRERKSAAEATVNDSVLTVRLQREKRQWLDEARQLLVAERPRVRPRKPRDTNANDDGEEDDDDVAERVAELERVVDAIQRDLTEVVFRKEDPTADVSPVKLRPPSPRGAVTATEQYKLERVERQVQNLEGSVKDLRAAQREIEAKVANVHNISKTSGNQLLFEYERREDIDRKIQSLDSRVAILEGDYDPPSAVASDHHHTATAAYPPPKEDAAEPMEPTQQQRHNETSDNKAPGDEPLTALSASVDVEEDLVEEDDDEEEKQEEEKEEEEKKKSDDKAAPPPHSSPATLAAPPATQPTSKPKATKTINAGGVDLELSGGADESLDLLTDDELLP